MKLFDKILATTLILFVAVSALGAYSAHKPVSGSATSLCDVTTTKVSIGHQAATTLLSAGSYQWVQIVQPINATNTVYLGIATTPVAGSGSYLTPATTTSPVQSVTLGFSVDRPFKGAIQAITNNGSSTVEVLTCK